MTVERRLEIRRNITDALRVLTTIDAVAQHVLADPSYEELEAIHVLLARGLERVDALLLEMSADRLQDERDGTG